MNTILEPRIEPESASVPLYRENDEDCDDLRPWIGIYIGVILSSVLWTGIIWAAIWSWR